MFIINTFSTCFGHHYVHLQENKTCVTACGVLRWFCWMWLVAVVGRCVVGCEHCGGYCSVLAPYNTAPHNRNLHSARTLQYSAPQPQPSQCSHPTIQRPTTATFTVLAPYNTAPHNRNLHSARTPQRSAPQPLPTTSSRTSAAHHMQ